MITRFTLAVLGASLLFGSACADAQQKDEASVKAQEALPMPTTDADWRDLDPENTLYIKTAHGTMVVELAPEFAPKHVARIKKLTRQKFYDDITFHRVIGGFMNQTGDPKGDGTGQSEDPDLEGEFMFRRDPSSMNVTLVNRQMFKDTTVDTGFYKAFPVATKPAGQAMLTKDGAVAAWGVHCKYVTSMARGPKENSANSQFFLLRDKSPQLNQSYTIWGTTVWGRDVLYKIAKGEMGKTPNFVPDIMEKVNIGADLPESERIAVQVLRTDSNAFRLYLDSLKSRAGKYPEVCKIKVPTRLKP